jgi:hypothetical protein
VALTACVTIDEGIFPCEPDGGCGDGTACVAGFCVPRATGSGPAGPDAGRPAAGADASVDAGADAGAGAGLDGGVDGGAPDGGDAGQLPGTCFDLVDGPLLSKWSATAPTEVVTTTVSSIANGLSGRAVRAVTTAAFDFLFQLQLDSPVDVNAARELSFAMRGSNTNSPGWQGQVPFVVLVDQAGGRRTYTPTAMTLSVDGLTWSRYRVPLEGDATWATTGTVNLATLSRIELHVDTWGAGFTLDLDAVSFDTTTCSRACPAGCGLGTCDTARQECACPLGYGGPTCSRCAPGFDGGLVDGGSRCLLPLETTERHWPNSASRANSDAWLQVHHAEIQTMRPVVLALNFVNDVQPAQAQALLDRITTAVAEASRSRAPGRSASSISSNQSSTSEMVSAADRLRPSTPSGRTACSSRDDQPPKRVRGGSTRRRSSSPASPNTTESETRTRQGGSSPCASSSSAATSTSCGSSALVTSPTSTRPKSSR